MDKHITNTIEENERRHEQRAVEIAAEAAKPYRKGGRNLRHPNQRAEQIHRLLTTDYDCCQGVDPESSLGDMLADALHFAKAYGLDYERALALGRFHFAAELEEEAEDEAWEAAHPEEARS